MGIKVDHEPHSQSTVGTAAPAVAAARQFQTRKDGEYTHSLCHMGIKVQEPHSQSTVGTAAPAVAAVPPAVAYTLSASLSTISLPRVSATLS
jgi:hypothetical protein